MVELSVNLNFGTALIGLAFLVIALKLEEIVKLIKDANKNVSNSNDSSQYKNKNKEF